MLRIGLQFFAAINLMNPVYAVATEANGAITYSGGAALAPAIAADVVINSSKKILYGNGAAQYVDDSFVGGTVKFDSTYITDALKVAVLGYVEGAEIDPITGAKELSKGDVATPVFVGFGFYGPEVNEAGQIRYHAIWLQKVHFALTTRAMKTKGESLEFQTPILDGTIMQAIDGLHIKEGTFSTAAGAVAWLNTKAGISSAVSTGLTALSGSNLTLSPVFGAAIFNYSGVATGDVAITATASGVIKLYIDGVYNQTLTTTVAGTAVPMAVGANKLFTIVITESGKTAITTRIMVQRAAG